MAGTASKKRPKAFALGPRQESWLRDLETTKVRQVKGALALRSGGFCCLGRACVVARKLGVRVETSTELDDGKFVTTYGGEPHVLPDLVKDFFGFHRNSGQPLSSKVSMDSLAEMNDNGKTFKQIAAAVRAEPEAYFSVSM